MHLEVLDPRAQSSCLGPAQLRPGAPEEDGKQGPQRGPRGWPRKQGSSGPGWTSTVRSPRALPSRGPAHSPLTLCKDKGSVPQVTGGKRRAPTVSPRVTHRLSQPQRRRPPTPRPGTSGSSAPSLASAKCWYDASPRAGLPVAPASMLPGHLVGWRWQFVQGPVSSLGPILEGGPGRQVGHSVGRGPHPRGWLLSGSAPSWGKKWLSHLCCHCLNFHFDHQ